MRLGIDALLCGNYVPEITAGFPKRGFALGVLWRVDGIKPSRRALKAVLDTGKCKTVRIHCQWKDRHDFKESDIAIAVKRCTKIAAFMKAYPDVKLLVSPWLEHDANIELITKCIKKCRAVLPAGTIMVNCGTGDVPNAWKERHHENGACEIFSFDGEGFSASKCKQYKKTHANCKIFFGWDWILNCRKNKQDTTLRAERTLKPTVEYLKEMAKILKES